MAELRLFSHNRMPTGHLPLEIFQGASHTHSNGLATGSPRRVGEVAGEKDVVLLLL